MVALGIALMARAGTGLSPYEVLHQGIARHSPLSLGQASVATGLVVLFLWLPLRQVPGLGTVLNSWAAGSLVDLSVSAPWPTP